MLGTTAGTVSRGQIPKTPGSAPPPRAAPEGMPPKRNAVVTTGPSAAVNACLGRVLSIGPQARDAFMLCLVPVAAFDFPASARHSSLHGPLPLCGLLAAVPRTRSRGSCAARLLALRAAGASALGGLGPLRLPTPHWALMMLASLGRAKVSRACRAAFRACTQPPRRAGLSPGGTWACPAGTARRTAARRAAAIRHKVEGQGRHGDLWHDPRVGH